MTTVGIFRLFPSLPGCFLTGKSFQVVFRALATVGWLEADFFRGSAIRFSSATNHRGAAALPLQNLLPLPAPAFEDRGAPTGIAPSPERLEAKPEENSDHNYSQTSSSQNHYKFRKARHRDALWLLVSTPQKHCSPKGENRGSRLRSLREICWCTVNLILPKTIDASGISVPPWSYGVPPASSNHASRRRWRGP